MQTKRLTLLRVATWALGAWAAVGMAATGCNTSQAPDRQINDAQITTQVKSKLASDVGASTLTNIDVNTTSGVVTLAGQVQSVDIKHSAEADATAVPGVIKVNNDLQVSADSAAR